MSEPHEFLSSVQKDGSELQAKEIFEETWNWLNEIGVSSKVSVPLIERYVISSARWIQCEEITSKLGFLSKHPQQGNQYHHPLSILEYLLPFALLFLQKIIALLGHFSSL